MCYAQRMAVIFLIVAVPIARAADSSSFTALAKELSTNPRAAIAKYSTWRRAAIRFGTVVIIGGRFTVQDDTHGRKLLRVVCRFASSDAGGFGNIQKGVVRMVTLRIRSAQLGEFQDTVNFDCKL